jgi:hypothetical protein
LDWVEITHPFHPLRGQRLRILKGWQHAGRSLLILEGTPAGTYSIPTAWTSAAPALSVEAAPLFSPVAVFELLELLSDLTADRPGGLDGGGDRC